MTHLHLPDGFLPPWLWVSGLALVMLLVGASVRTVRPRDYGRRLPALSMVAAFMIVAMSIPVIPAVYHVQFVGLAGIILGPAMGMVAVFIVNLLLALVGHGGITVVGLNSLILGAEMFTAWLLFRGLRRITAAGPAAGMATLLAMVIGAVVMLGIFALATPQAGTMHLEEVTAPHFGEHHEHGGEVSAHAPHESLSLTRLAWLVFGLGAIGWVLESAATGLAVRFIARVKPDLIEAKAVHERV